MISAIAWVKRGAAARIPKTEGALDEGVEDVSDPVTAANTAANATASAAAAANASGKSSGKRRAAPAAEAAVDSDDSDDDDESDHRVHKLTAGNLMYYGSNAEDPHMKIREDEEDDSELDDFEIHATDLVLLGARSDEQLSSLEAYVYEEPADNLYPHHDIPLPVFPLCVAWFDFRPNGGSGGSGGGNFAAVGTFAPYIEVWDLDVMDALEPYMVIGAEAYAIQSEEQFTSHAAEALAASSRQSGGSEGKQKGKEKKGKKKKTLGGGSGGGNGPQGHTDAVMCLSWNKLQPNALASGSADNTVRLWDLEGDCAGSLSCLTHHRDKVQAVAWHPTEAPALLTAGFDRRAVAVDVRAPDANTAREWSLSADAEKVCWHPSGTSFCVSSEDGIVQCFDVRTGAKTKPLWSLQAHEGACAGLDINSNVDGLMATGGNDNLVKVWSLSSSNNKPTLIGKRNMKLGAIFDVSFCTDSPALLAAGGSKGKIGIWNTLELEEVQSKLPGAEAAIGEDGRVLSGAVAGMGALEVNSSSDEEDGGADGEGTDKEGGGASSSKTAKAKGKAKAAAVEEEDDDDDEDDDDEDDEDDDDEEEEGAKQQAAIAARVKAAAAAAGKKARRSKAKATKARPKK